MKRIVLVLALLVLSFNCLGNHENIPDSEKGKQEAEILKAINIRAARIQAEAQVAYRADRKQEMYSGKQVESKEALQVDRAKWSYKGCPDFNNGKWSKKEVKQFKKIMEKHLPQESLSKDHNNRPAAADCASYYLAYLKCSKNKLIIN